MGAGQKRICILKTYYKALTIRWSLGGKKESLIFRLFLGWWLVRFDVTCSAKLHFIVHCCSLVVASATCHVGGYLQDGLAWGDCHLPGEEDLYSNRYSGGTLGFDLNEGTWLSPCRRMHLNAHWILLTRSSWLQLLAGREDRKVKFGHRLDNLQIWTRAEVIWGSYTWHKGTTQWGKRIIIES